MKGNFLESTVFSITYTTTTGIVLILDKKHLIYSFCKITYLLLYKILLKLKL